MGPCEYFSATNPLASCTGSSPHGRWIVPPCRLPDKGSMNHMLTVTGAGSNGTESSIHQKPEAGRQGNRIWNVLDMRQGLPDSDSTSGVPSLEAASDQFVACFEGPKDPLGILARRRLHSSARCQAVNLASTSSICA
jgi:hypothetical protein